HYSSITVHSIQTCTRSNTHSRHTERHTHTHTDTHTHTHTHKYIQTHTYTDTHTPPQPPRSLSLREGGECDSEVRTGTDGDARSVSSPRQAPMSSMPSYT